MAWNLDADRPIYLQLVEQIKLCILKGEYPVGSKLPSVRDLAAQAAVNPNTMQRAFAELEKDGLVQSIRTSGRFITDDGGLIETMKLEMAKEMVDEFFEKMNQLGYQRSEVATIIKQQSEEGQ